MKFNGIPGQQLKVKGMKWQDWKLMDWNEKKNWKLKNSVLHFGIYFNTSFYIILNIKSFIIIFL